MHSQGTPEYIPLPDGRRLYAQVLPPAAESGITVVFESGGASTRSIWARVQPQIAACARGERGAGSARHVSWTSATA